MKYFLMGIFIFFQCVLTHAQRKTQPFVIGETDTLYSKILNETRTLNIYLPQGYSPDSSAKYPVIYLLDGGADEDFIHMAGLVQFFNFPWINRFPESIVVGIVNTNRQRDFTFPVNNLSFLKPMGFDSASFTSYGKSENFISFIEKELQPFIDKNYKTNASKTIIGQSLGGLLTTEILIKKPALFDTYIIISPSLWWNKASLLKETGMIPEKEITTKTKVYIGVGNEGKMMVNDAKSLSQLIKKRKQTTVHYDFLPNENHATISHQALMNAFKLLYPEKKK